MDRVIFVAVVCNVRIEGLMSMYSEREGENTVSSARDAYAKKRYGHEEMPKK